MILLCICSTVTMLVKGPGSSLVGLPWLWVWNWDKSWNNTADFYLMILFSVLHLRGLRQLLLDPSI